MIGLKTKNNLISEDTQQNKHNIQISYKNGSSEIWSDKLKVLYNRHTESRRERR